jgi:hypothetical protein
MMLSRICNSGEWVTKDSGDNVDGRNKTYILSECVAHT